MVEKKMGRIIRRARRQQQSRLLARQNLKKMQRTGMAMVKDDWRAGLDAIEPPREIVHSHRFITPSTYSGGGGKLPKEPVTNKSSPPWYFSAVVCKWLSDIGLVDFRKPGQLKRFHDMIEQDQYWALWFRNMVLMIYGKGETLKPLRELVLKIDDGIITEEQAKYLLTSWPKMLLGESDQSIIKDSLEWSSFDKIKEKAREDLYSFVETVIENVVKDQDEKNKLRLRLYEAFFPEYRYIEKMTEQAAQNEEGMAMTEEKLYEGSTKDKVEKFKNSVAKDIYFATRPKR